MNSLRIILFSILDSEPEDSNNYIIAKYILDNYSRLAGISLTNLAKQCNVSKASVSRFCRKLGLYDYIDLQMLIRLNSNDISYRNDKLSIEQQKQIFCNELNNSTLNMVKIINDPVVEELISDIIKYNSISIFGHLQSSHIAYTLRNNLAMLSKFCFCSQVFTEQKKKILESTPKDLLIIFSSSGNFFKRLDINMNNLEKNINSKVYLISFENDDITLNNVKKIYLGKEYQDLISNITMNMLVNYLSYRVASSVSFYET